MALGLFLVALGLCAPLRTRFALPNVALPVLCVVLVPWMQWAFGLLHFTGDAWVSTFYLTCLALAIGTGFACANTAPRTLTNLLCGTSLTAGLVSSVMAVLQCLQVGEFGIWMFEIAPGDRAVANLAQPNDLALLLGLATLGLWHLRLQHCLGRAASAAMLVLLLIGSALTQSRTSLLFGPVVIAVLFSVRAHAVAWRRQVLTVFCAVMLQILLVCLWPILSSALLLTPSYSLLDTGVQTGRLQVWPVLLDAVGQSPWIGYGWLQTGAAQLAVADRHPPGVELFLHSHNIILDLVLWCGLPLGLLMAAALLTWFVRRVRGAASMESQFGIMAVALFSTHAMLELPHHFLLFLIPIGLWIGLVERECDARDIGQTRAMPALVVATVLTGLALAFDYPAVEADFRQVRFAESGIEPPKPAASTVDAPLLSTLTASIRLARTPAVAGMSTKELEEMAAIVKRYPFSPALYRYACALALNGQLDASLRAFKSIRHLYGEARYARLQRALHQEVSEGHEGLRALDRALLG